MCLMLPISSNYLKGWKKTELSLENVQERVNQPNGSTMSEIIEGSDLIKPYVDIDHKVSVAQYDSENARLRQYWTEQLAPLCPSPGDLAVSTRSLPDVGDSMSKISFHFILNGIKCRAELVGTFLSQFVGQTGFDKAAYVKYQGGPRV